MGKMPLWVHVNIYYLVILFRERGRKSATAPGWLAFIDALAWHPRDPRRVSPLRICAYAHVIYSLIME